MLIFPIEFTVKGIAHVASVHKLTGYKASSIQYHVFDITPELNIQNSIFSVNSEASGLEYGLEPDHSLSHTIANSILEGCDKAGIPRYT